MKRTEEGIPRGQIRRLGPRALAAIIRRAVLPIESWLAEGEYRPFVEEFARRSDSAAPWMVLGNQPGSVGSLALDAVDSRGSTEEKNAWSVIWSAAKTMELARTGAIRDAGEQFDHTVQLIADWPETVAEHSRQLRRQIAESVQHVVEITAGMDDPPVDDDTLMIPAFYAGGGRRPDAALEVTGASRSFEAEVEELVRRIKEGRIAVVCGAGISIASGVPSATALRRAVLAMLPASEVEVELLAETDLPFEAFMEVLSKAPDFEPLLKVFVGRGPCAAHSLLADLVARGFLRSIATTNFDELIETALGSSSVSVTKIHGTISDPRSIAVTMEAVASRRRLPKRDRAVARLFADGDHDAVLVVGYSCSDEFDVTPAIEALGDSLKRIWIVEHEPGSEHAEDIVSKPWKNPFRKCRSGTRLFYDTDLLFARIAREVLAQPYEEPGVVEDDWLTDVQRWWGAVPEGSRPAVGHWILGQLWYLCGDFRAAKAHYRAWRASTPIHDLAVRCWALLQIAGCHRALSEYRRALDRGKEAHRLALALDDDSLEAEACGTLGNAWFNMGEDAKAVEWYEREVEILRKLGDAERALGKSLANLGNAYGQRRELEKALECFREGVELARDVGDKVGEGSRLGGLGQVLSLLERWEEAEKAHVESLRIARAMGDLPGIAMQVARLAVAKSEQDLLDDAIDMAIEAAKRFGKMGDRKGESRALGDLGGYLVKAGRAAEAIDPLRKSAAIAAAIQDASALEVAQQNLAAAIVREDGSG